jgi:hypothetical protein
MVETIEDTNTILREFLVEFIQINKNLQNLNKLLKEK